MKKSNQLFLDSFIILDIVITDHVLQYMHNVIQQYLRQHWDSKVHLRQSACVFQVQPDQHVTVYLCHSVSLQICQEEVLKDQLHITQSYAIFI